MERGERKGIVTRRGREEFGHSFNARRGREVYPKFDDIIEAIDWNRVLIQSYGLHAQIHAKHTEHDATCGECIKTILLRKDE